MRPHEKFNAWIDEHPAEVEAIKAKHGLSAQEFNKHVAGMVRWLIKYEHSPRAKSKRAWKRFLTNNLPRNNNEPVRSFTKDRDITGEHEMP